MKTLRLGRHLTPPVNSVTQPRLLRSVSNSKRLCSEWKSLGFCCRRPPAPLPGRSSALPPRPRPSPPRDPQRSGPGCGERPGCQRREPLQPTGGCPAPAPLQTAGPRPGALPAGHPPPQGRSGALGLPLPIRCFAFRCKYSRSPWNLPPSNPENPGNLLFFSFKKSFPHFKGSTHTHA